MKKSFLSIFMMVAVCAISNVVISCGSNDKEEASKKETVKTDTETPTVAKVDHEGFTPGINIRFIDLDTLMAHFDFAIQETKKLEQKSLELQQYQNSLTSQIQKKQNEIQQKADNNIYLSQQSYESDMKDYQQLVQNADANYGKRAQNLSAEMAKVQEAIYNTIENYVIKYNLDKKYDAILYRNTGIYFNPSLDITDEILKGLNAENPVK